MEACRTYVRPLLSENGLMVTTGPVMPTEEKDATCKSHGHRAMCSVGSGGQEGAQHPGSRFCPHSRGEGKTGPSHTPLLLGNTKVCRPLALEDRGLSAHGSWLMAHHSPLTACARPPPPDRSRTESGPVTPAQNCQFPSNKTTPLRSYFTYF